MTISRPKYEQFYWTLIWLGVSAIAWYFVHLKYLALDFHTRDYAFYTEFIIKWSRPTQEQYYSMNPGGYNFLGVNTVDGCDGFYQWVHFEPIRFVQAFIYKIFHSLQAVFAFNALLVCSPILAIGLWLKKSTIGFWEKMIWALFFIIFPATLLVAGYDNRPSMFIGVGYFWLIYFLLATKNKWGQYISFLLLFSISEEALILNGLVCLYLFFKWRRREVSADWFLLHLVTLIAYVIGLSSYFNYWNYELFADSTNKYSVFVLLPFIVLGLVMFIYVLLKRKYDLLLFLPLLLFILQIVSMYVKGIFPDEKFSIYNDPRILIAFLICLSWMLYHRLSGKKLSSYIVMGAIPCFVFVLSIGEYGLPAKIAGWRSKYRETIFVFDYAGKYDVNKKVIADYSTHQAFLNFPNLYCVDRLPCYIEKSDKRFYPNNRDLMMNILMRSSLVVVTKETEGKIHPLFKIAMFDSTIFTNEYFMFTRKSEKFLDR